MNQANVVLTGLPRSGTTLTCHLLNKLPDTVALHEPIAPGKFAHYEDERELLDGVEEFFTKMRRMALREGQVISKHVGGEVPDNSFRSTKSEAGLRSSKAEKGKSRGKISVHKDLDRDFLLIIKHPAMFSALLPTLAKRFSAFAVVRNPLAILASWNSIDHNLLNGRSPAAEKYSKRLRRELNSIEDRTDRQLHVLSWWYERFYRTLPDAHIIRYEDIVSSGGKALSVISPSAASLEEPLESKNSNPIYDRERTLELGDKLLASGGPYWRLYSKESVEELMQQLA